MNTKLFDISKKYFIVLFLFVFVSVFVFSAQNVTAAVQSLYVSASGGGSTCSAASPCTLATALNVVSGGDGDTIILAPGTYQGGIYLNDATDHDNLTITTTKAVKNALTFKRGIAKGTDNRPYFPDGQLKIANGVSGTTTEYVRVRGSASPSHGFWGVVEIFEYKTTIKYSEFWHGGAGVMFRTSRGPITLSNCYIHDCGSVADDPDDHAITSWADVNDGNGSSWNDKTLVEHTTIGGNIGGDGFQAATADDHSGRYDAYFEFSHCDFIATFDEQMIDTKGLRYMKIHDCNFTGTTGLASNENGWIMNTTYDDGADRNSNFYWYIYNNLFNATASGVIHIGGISSYWYIWNNVIYDNIKLSPYEGNSGTLPNIKLPGSSTFVHNTIIANNKASSISWANVALSSSGNIVQNNLLYNNASESGDHGNLSTVDYQGGAKITNNFIYPTNCPSGSCTTGTNYQSSERAQVVSASTGNFTLNNSSECIDNAVPLKDNGIFKPTIDAAGNARGAGDGWDIGAYEFNGTVAPTPVNEEVKSPQNLRVVSSSN
jgi:hypothetical protein